MLWRHYLFFNDVLRHHHHHQYVILTIPIAIFEGHFKPKKVYCQTSVLSLPTVGSLMDHRASKPYTLMGPPV